MMHLDIYLDFVALQDGVPCVSGCVFWDLADKHGKESMI